MAWWDHEDLKALADKSNKYILTFPEGYSKEELEKAAKEYEETRKWLENKISESNKRIQK